MMRLLVNAVNGKAQDEIAVVRALFDAFDDGDLDRAASMVDEAFELVDIAAGQTFRGPEGCRRWLEIFRTALPDARTEIVNAFAQDGRVATEHVGRGTHSGPFVTPAGTIPVTGRRLELRLAELYEVRDGKIMRLHAYYDSSTILRQLGLLPAGGSAGERLMTSRVRLGRALGRARR